MRNPEGELASLRDKLKGGERGGSDTDREALLEFDRRLRLVRNECGAHRRLKYLRHATRISEEAGDLAEAPQDREASERIVDWILREYDNPETSRDYRMTLRMFARRVTDGDDIPEAVSWVKTNTPHDYDPAPNPGEMLEWNNDVEPMIEATRNDRDAALIAVQFDAGLRSGELQELTIGQISDADHGLCLFVDGKTGQRSVTLIPSVPYLNRWLSSHPAPKDPKAPLWSKLTRAEEISYQMLLKTFKEAAKRADIQKPVTPTAFRKSNASWLARQGASAHLIEDRQGRSRGSEMAARYVARFGKESEGRQYAKLHGVEIEDEESPEELTPTDCPRCRRENPPSESACVWCGQALDVDAADKVKRDERELRKAVFTIAQENPALLEDIKKARELMDFFEENPAMLEDGMRFLEELKEA